MGIHRLGDLLSPAMHEAEKTLAVYMVVRCRVKELISQKNRDMEARNQLSLRLKKLENEREDLTNFKEKWSM